jgi:hypothetical protein
MTIRISFSDKTVMVVVEINGAIESAITELPKREWVGLTDDDINEVWKELPSEYNDYEHAYAIEAKLKEKNT